MIKYSIIYCTARPLEQSGIQIVCGSGGAEPPPFCWLRGFGADQRSTPDLQYRVLSS